MTDRWNVVWFWKMTRLSCISCASNAVNADQWNQWSFGPHWKRVNCTERIYLHLLQNVHILRLWFVSDLWSFEGLRELSMCSTFTKRKLVSVY